MKTLFVVLLTALTVSSLQAASDTLKVESLRTIDLCSGEQRWLITASIGEVYASDSLQSFDITIGYDTSRIAPVDGLSIGTLSDQMRALGGPFFTFNVPGEMRVGGFTINTNVKGDLPVFAIAGTFKGDCLYADTLTFPFFPSFNGEFQGEIKELRSDTITRVVNPIDLEGQGVQITEDTVFIKNLDSTGVATLVAYHSMFSRKTLLMKASLEDVDRVLIDTILSDEELHDVHISENRKDIEFLFDANERDSTQLKIVLRNISNDTLGVTKITSQLFDTTRCSCSKPVMTDSAMIETREPITSVNEDVHDSTVNIIHLNSDRIEMQFSHGQLWNIQLIDLLGRRLLEEQVFGLEAQLSLTNIPSGAYLLYVSNGSESVVKKILK